MAESDQPSRSPGPFLIILGVIIAAILLAIVLSQTLRMHRTSLWTNAPEKGEAAHSPAADKIYREARGKLAAFLVTQGFTHGTPDLPPDGLYSTLPGTIVLNRNETDGSLSTVSICDHNEHGGEDRRKLVGCVWEIGFRENKWIWSPGKWVDDSMNNHLNLLISAWWTNYVATHPADFSLIFPP